MTEKWRTGEENAGGGFNIYRGAALVAHTAEVSAVSAGAMGWEVITAAQAKDNARLIVDAVNSRLK